MLRFESGQLERDEIRPTLERIVKGASRWLALHSESSEEEAPPPDITTIREAVEFLGRYSGPWIKPHLADGVISSWLRWVDACGDDELIERELWPAVDLHAAHLFSWGDYLGVLQTIASSGRFRAEDAPTPIRGGLLALRVDTYRALGRYREALADVETLTEFVGDAPTLQDELLVAGTAFNVEIEIGRLDLAAGRLAEMERTIAALYGAASPFEKGRLDAEKWISRVLFHLGVGEHKAALSAVPVAIESFSDEFMVTLAGMRAADQLRYFAYLAARRDQADAGVAAGSLDAAVYLKSRSTLGSHGKGAVRLEHALQLGSMGNWEGAWTELEELVDARGQREASLPFLEESPLLGMRLASRRYETAIGLSDPNRIESTSAELQAAFERWLESWRDVPKLAGGIGFLQHEERRRALHLVVHSMLGSLGDHHDPQATRRALDVALKADGCGTVAARLDCPPATAASLVEFAAREDCAVVYLVPGPLGTHRFTILADRVDHQVLEPMEAIVKKLAPVLKELRRPRSFGQDADPTWPPAPLSHQVAWLSERLVPKGSYEAIYFAGLDDLGFVPVEVLNSRNGRPLGLDTIVARAPSLAALIAIEDSFRGEDPAARSFRDGDQEPSRMELYISTGSAIDPVSRDVLPSLNYSVAEYAALRRATNASIRVRRESEATQLELVRSIERKLDLLVTFSHGAHSSTPPLAPGLFLRSRDDKEPDLPLFTSVELAHALESSPAAGHTRVALIAACQAGAGPRRQGDSGASSFSGVLLGAGIPTALVSDERIEEETAKALIQSFAESFLAEGNSVGASLLYARRKVAASTSTRHPHFWSALKLFGWAGTRKR